jgi:hypothetical protein
VPTPYPRITSPPNDGVQATADNRGSYFSQQDNGMYQVAVRELLSHRDSDLLHALPVRYTLARYEHPASEMKRTTSQEI